MQTLLPPRESKAGPHWLRHRRTGVYTVAVWNPYYIPEGGTWSFFYDPETGRSRLRAVELRTDQAGQDWLYHAPSDPTLEDALRAQLTKTRRSLILVSVVLILLSTSVIFNHHFG